MSHFEIHIVPPLAERKRLSDYCINIFQAIPTKSGIKKAIKRGHVELDGRVASTGDWLQGGEQIKLEDHRELSEYPLKYPVLLEDDHIAIIHKPAGIAVHSHSHRNIQNSLAYNLKPSMLEHSMKIPRPVHRLDYDTSGLLIIAKSYEAMTQLVKMISERLISKSYLAIVIGDIPESGIINTTIEGKEAITNYKVIQSVTSEKYQQLNMVEINLITGRRNQIRKHFLDLGNPILGDKKFFHADKLSYGNGLYLLAKTLGFDHPISGKRIDLSLPTPKKFLRIFEN